MQDKSPSRLNWAAMVNGAVRSFARIDFELLKQRAKPHACALLTDADSHGSVFVMDAQSDDGPLETRIGHPRHCKKQFAGKKTRLIHCNALSRPEARRKS
jgi:hypothetical protein